MPYASPALRERRQAAGIKPGRFAKAVGVTPSHLCHVEAGRNKASLELLHLCATELSVDVGDLIAAEQSAGAA